MNNYYFIGRQSAATAEIIKILQETKASFTKIQPDKYGLYRVENDKIDAIIQEGFNPVVIGIDCCRQDVRALKKYRRHVNGSPLEEVAIWENVPLDDWRNLVLANDEDFYNDYPYSTEIMRELCYKGFSRDEIEKVRAYDRSERGISEAEEMAAEEAVQKHSAEHKGLLVITGLPHQKYRAVLDRVFWMQPMQNTVIFTNKGKFLYAGFADVCLGLMKDFHVWSNHYCWTEGYYADMAEQMRIIKYLVSLSKIKKADGIL